MTIPTIGDIGQSHNWPELYYHINLLRGSVNAVIGAVNNLNDASTLTIADGDVLANISGSPAPATGTALTAVFDHDLGNTNGMVATRIGGVWLASFTTQITGVGVITTGTWQGAVIAGQYGGTGVANTGFTITLGGNLTTSGAFATTLTVTAATNSTLPAGTHTLAGLDVAQNWAANQTNANGWIASGNGSYFQHAGVTFANLPASPAAGMFAYVTDSTVNTWGSTIAGGGTNKVLGWYNGTNWTVIGA